MPTTKKTTTVKKEKKVVPKKVAPKKTASVKKVVEDALDMGPATPGGKYFYANGKRKTSIARVRLYNGAGAITVNDKKAAEYFVKTLVGLIKSPLKLVGMDQKFDVIAITKGGGMNSQAEALRHGIAKALLVADVSLRPTLKKAGMLTRDSRMKERKKFGLKRARKGPQFSKR